MTETSITENENAPPATTAARKNVECGFCGCTLAADGGVIKTSDYQQKLLRAEDKLADANRAIEKHLSEIVALKAEIEGLRPASDAPKKKFGIRR